MEMQPFIYFESIREIKKMLNTDSLKQTTPLVWKLKRTVHQIFANPNL